MDSRRNGWHRERRFRIVVYDQHLDAADQMRRIRDAFSVYDGLFDDC